MNEFFKNRYKLSSQYLHAYKIVFNKLGNELDYLNNKQFISEVDCDMKALEKDLFGL